MILDSLDDVNWAAVAVSSVAAFAIGAVWFSPAILGSRWARIVSGYSRIPEADITGAASQGATLAKWFVAIAVNAVILGLAVAASGADGAGEGALLGLVLGIGLGATLFAWPPIFTRMPWTWWAINSGAFLLMQLAMGAILGAWD